MTDNTTQLTIGGKRMTNFIVVDTVTEQGYGIYQGATGAHAVLAAAGDFDRTPEDGDVYHVYELLGSGSGILNAQSLEWPVNVVGAL